MMMVVLHCYSAIKINRSTNCGGLTSNLTRVPEVDRDPPLT